MKPAVLFVCPHGAAKSGLAAAYFQHLAELRGLPYTAVCAGTEPDSAFNSAVVAWLQGQGLPLPAGAPRRLTAGDLAVAFRAVALGYELDTQATHAVLDWSHFPPLSVDFDAGRAAIETRVGGPVDELVLLAGRN